MVAFPKKTMVLVLLAALLSASWAQLRELPAESYPKGPDGDAASGTAASRGGTPLLPVAIDGIFATSGTCNLCHGLDSLGISSVNGLGQDVNVVDDWRSSMMGNSARDPFWLAKVSHETLVHPGRLMDTENLCTSCHAPTGHFASSMSGLSHYGMVDLAIDPIGIDGVSCGACHQQEPLGLRHRHSGQLVFDTSYQIAGPYGSPISQPMIDVLGLEPVLGSHMLKSEVCAGCHTLITQTLDLSGNLTGAEFVEQATYHEWVNSRYGAEQISCQSCHMPRITDPVNLSSLQDTLPARTPFGLHELVGANTFMIKLMKENRNVLDIPASADHFDATLQATVKMLRTNSLELDLQLVGLAADSASFSVLLHNLAGHKFPSGYPSRRTYVEFLVLTQTGDTLFHSGAVQASGNPAGLDSPYEPHHQVIRDPGQVQVYEMVPGDVNGQFTTVLTQAASPLKDNRIPPEGFLTTHFSYDTTTIAGEALTDPDFNRQGGIEGSGTDGLTYRIGLDGYRGPAKVYTRVWYQSVPKTWLEEMFSYSSLEINQFKSMFEAADQSHELVVEDSLDVLLNYSGWAGQTTEPRLKLLPNPSADGRFQLQCNILPESVEIYDLNGKLWLREYPKQINPAIQGPALPGQYLLRAFFAGGKSAVIKYGVIR